METLEVPAQVELKHLSTFFQFLSNFVKIKVIGSVTPPHLTSLLCLTFKYRPCLIPFLGSGQTPQTKSRREVGSPKWYGKELI